MSTYIGKVNIKSSFYNVKPIGEIVDKEFKPFTQEDIEQLIPDSDYHNINLHYNFREEEHCKIMRERFKEDGLVLLDFEVDELEDNMYITGERNPTGYKIPCENWLEKGKIRFLSDIGLYRFVPEDELLDDIEANQIVRIDNGALIDKEEVFLKLKTGMCLGPYEVNYNAQRRTYFVKPQAEKYILKGYMLDDLEEISITTIYDENSRGSKIWSYYRIKQNANLIEQDVVTNKELLEAFRDNVCSKSNSVIYIDGIDDILERYGDSLFAGDNISDDIRKKRNNRIKELLSSEAHLEETYKQVAEVLYGLIIKNKEDKNTEILIETMLEQKPDLMDKLQTYKIIKSRIDEARRELEEIQSETQSGDVQRAAISDSDLEAKLREKLDGDLKEKQEELDKLLEKLQLAEEIEDINNKLDELEEEKKYRTKRNTDLENATERIKTKFTDMVNGYSDDIVKIAFDGYVSSKLLEAASKWEQTEYDNDLQSVVSQVNEVDAFDCNKEELLDYLVNTIQKVRPQYDRNVIINLFICVLQGFLTVLSGTPGCGKTSICNIISKTLGLNCFNKKVDKKSDMYVDRYIVVSVERGWTSKRDFVGYYNPLTKAFEESNRDVFDGLQILNAEAKEQINKYPFFILLDEANLSSMEYYWADFMNICDDLEDNHSINLGNSNVYDIPETLHFLATINNDHTTETLSPRLIDRAWIINLPKVGYTNFNQKIEDKDIKQISWESLKKVFLNYDIGKLAFSNEVQKIYDGLKDVLSKQNTYISPRVDIAIKKYWTVASELMEEDEYSNTPEVIALDYAIAQKVLPTISGSGDDYETWLNQLKDYCANNNLLETSDILTGIIERGNRQLKYYKFFE